MVSWYYLQYVVNIYLQDACPVLRPRYYLQYVVEHYRQHVEGTLSYNSQGIYGFHNMS